MAMLNGDDPHQRKDASAPIPVRYRAFFSYSHSDAKSGKRLHRRLETYRVDKELIGSVGAMGPIPKALRPIFRDREDFPAGERLKDQTIAALDASAAQGNLSEALVS